MEQSFLLKQYGNLSLFEQSNMPAEERAWWIKRIDKENKQRKSAEESQMPKMPKMATPPKIEK